MVDTVSISIDAAAKGTYEKIRRGAHWEVLCDNMRYISSLKSSGEINKIQLNFVVQKENYNEMRDFVILGKEWKADKIIFTPLRNWGTYSNESFSVHDVLSVESPYFKEIEKILTELKCEEGNLISEGILNKPDSISNEE